MRSPKWRLFRQDTGRRAGPPAWAYVALFAFCSAVGEWSATRYGASVFWPANGVLLAALLQLDRRRAIAVLASCFAINVIGNFARPHTPLYMTFGLALLNQFEVFAAGMIARRFCGAALDLRRPRRFARFALIAVAPPVALATLAGLIALHPYRDRLWESLVDFQIWFSVHELGILLAAPALLLLARHHRFSDADRAPVWEKAALLGLLAVVTVTVFAQAAAPVMFLVFLPLLLIVFRLPPYWSTMSALMVAVMAAIATLNGYGPITLSTFGPAYWPFPEFIPALKLLPVLQMFIAAVVAVSLPVSTVITERRRLEARLKARTEAAVLARKQAELAAEAKSRFLSMMSHELRTPLHGVSGFAELLAGRECLDAEAASQVEQIRRSSGALARLLEDILDLSRGDAKPVNAPFALAGLIETAAAEAGADADAKGLRFAVSGDLDPGVRLMGDERRLRQVLRILLSNAVKFTARGRVELRVSLTEHGVEIAVSDTGKGLVDGAIATLFDAFVQGDASIGRDHEGAGMGLALAKRLVEAMGGSICAGNRPGGGAVFSLSLPLARAEPEAEAAAAAAGGELEAPRVLVVDDHPVNRQVASLMLQALGCETTLACDGLEAVKAARTQRFDLILMDVRMPKLDGLAATRRIRALKGATARTPIVAVTADAMPEDVARSAEAGMDGHLCKPVTGAQLAEVLARHLGGPAEAEAPAYSSAA
jgi:signal transduction histidine kinase/ActR/RegA family two-component response regulator